MTFYVVGNPLDVSSLVVTTSKKEILRMKQEDENVRFVACRTEQKAEKLRRSGWAVTDSTSKQASSSSNTCAPLSSLNTTDRKRPRSDTPEETPEETSDDTTHLTEGPTTTATETKTLSLEEFNALRDANKVVREKNAAIVRERLAQEQKIQEDAKNTQTFERDFPDLKFADLIPCMATRDMCRHYRHRATGKTYSTFIGSHSWHESETSVPLSFDEMLFGGRKKKSKVAMTLESVKLDGIVSVETITTFHKWRNSTDQEISVAKLEMANIIADLPITVKYAVVELTYSEYLILPSSESKSFWHIPGKTGHIFFNKLVGDHTCKDILAKDAWIAESADNSISELWTEA